MPAKINIPIIDFSDEKSTASIYTDNGVFPLDAAITAWFDAVDGVSIGTLEKSVLANAEDKDVGSTAVPANQYAQRETKWLARYTDDVTLKRYQFEIPCANLALLAGNTDFMDLTAGAGLELKTQFESIGQSPVGNAVTLNSVEHVGRNI